MTEIEKMTTLEIEAYLLARKVFDELERRTDKKRRSAADTGIYDLDVWEYTLKDLGPIGELLNGSS